MGAMLAFLVTVLAAPPDEEPAKAQEDNARAAARVIDPTYTPQAGDRAFVDSGARDEDGDPYAVVAAVSVDEFVNCFQAQFAHDNAAIDAMEKEKKIFLLDAGTAVQVIALTPIPVARVQLPRGIATRGAFCTEIKVLDGEEKGKVLYTVMQQVVRYVTVPAAENEPAPRTKTGKSKSVKTKKKPPPAAAAKPAADPNARAESMLKLGQNLEKAGKTAGAIEFYAKVIKQFPQSPQARSAEQRIKAIGKRSP